MYFMENMFCTRHLFIVLAITSQSNAVKVNMHGSLNLGKDVIQTLSDYLKISGISGRRSMGGSKEVDTITVIIRSAYLCRDLDFCHKSLGKFINEYVIVLAQTVETIFDGVLTENNEIEDPIHLPKSIIFEDELKICLRSVKKVLKSANGKITENNEVYVWIDVIKRICAIFQEAAIAFLSDSLQGKSLDLMEVKKRLTHKLVISTIVVEGKYENKLCTDFNICAKYTECTKALNDILDHFKTADEGQVQYFIRQFNDVLPDTAFYSKLSEVTANEFQTILNDMSYSKKMPTKAVMLSIQKAVKDRIEYKETNTHVVSGHDIELVNIILSDMDHIYSKGKVDPFYNFLSSFYEWSKTGGRLTSSLRQVMKDISKQLALAPTEILDKLTYEVKVFLELTVDPQE